MRTRESQRAELHFEADAHPCVFVKAGSHYAEGFRLFHSEGTTILVEWLDDYAILARGPLSWVCKRYVETSPERFQVVR